MIYLTNTVSAQTVSIPRNDNGGTPSVNPRSYQSGYTDGIAYQKSLLSSTAITENGEYSRENGFSAVSVNVPQTGSSLPLTAITITANTAITESEKAYTGITVNVPQTGYTQQDLDNAYNSGYTSGETAGYNSGYTSGETHQKSLLSSTAITENGEYQSENGFSAVSVNVPQTGITIPLTSITITANTAITETDKAYTGITVNVDTASTYNSGYTDGYASGETDGYNTGYASGYTSGETNGYTSGYSSGYTSGETVGYNSGYSVGYDSGSTDGYESGYTSGETVGYESGYTSGYSSGYTSGYTSGITEGENNIISTFSAMTATTNGNYGSSAHPLSAITVNVPQTGSSLPLSSITITGNTAITVNDKAYTGITVNVPSSSNVITRVDYICTDPLVDLSNLYIDTGIFPTTATTMRIKYIGTGYKPSAKILGYSWYGEEDVYNWAEDWEDYRFSFYPDIFQFHRQYLWDYNNSRLSKAEVNFTDEGAYVDLTFGNNYVYNNLTNTYVDTGDTQDYQAITNIPIMVNVSVIKLQSLEIWQGETKVFDGIAAYDNNGHIGLFDNITNTIVYNSALTMTYGTTGYTQQDLDNAYDSGYTSGETDGYTSGYTSGITEGENNIISTFSAMTATTNGNYGSSAHPLSSITVIIDTASTYNNGYTSGYTDGYSSGFSSGQTSIIDTFTAITATTNGVYGSTGYPLSSITVNVPQSDVTEAIISVTGNTWFILDHIFRYGEKINIKHTTFDYSAANVVRHQQLISGGQGEYLRIAGAGGTGNKLYVTYGNTNKAQIDYVLTDNEIELTPTEFYIDGVKVANVSSSTHTWNTNMVLFANTSAGSDSVSSQTASVGEITITNSANTITAHYVPTLDGNNVPCFYNTVSDNYIYAESGTPIYNSTVSFLTIDNLARRRYTYINPHISVNPRPYSFYEATELYGDLSFGNSVTSIGYAAFEACDNLNGTLTIPNSVTGIGEYAFAAEFSGTLTIPDSITEIKKGAFYGCNFTTVIIPSSVTDIKSTAFFWNQETDIYCYATTPPLIDDRIVGYSSSGRIHYPAGSDYTLWTQSSQFANWTFIDDL